MQDALSLMTGGKINATLKTNTDAHHQNADGTHSTTNAGKLPKNAQSAKPTNYDNEQHTDKQYRPKTRKENG